MIKKFLTIIVFMVIFSLNKKISYSYINIYPTKFDKVIEKELSDEFFLYNRTKKVLKYRVYLEKIENEKDMTPWIKIYPKSITLNPLEEKVIKMYIKAPKGVSKGEYFSQLVIKEIENPKEKKSEKVQVMTMLKMKMKVEVK